jgi:predicted kinase
MTKPILYMLIGLPATGKTTWSNKVLEADNSFVYLSTDNILEELGRNKGIDNYNEAFDKVNFKTVQNQFNRQLEEAIINQKNIVWDQSNITKKSRTDKLKKIPKCYHKIAVVFNTPEEIRIAYSNKRLEETGKVISHDVVNTMIKTLDLNMTDEGFEEILYIF